MRILAVDITCTLSPKVTPGLVESMETLGSSRGVIVIPEGESYPLSKSVTAIGLRKMNGGAHMIGEESTVRPVKQGDSRDFDLGSAVLILLITPCVTN